LGRLFRRRHAALPIEVPSDVLEAVLHLDGEIRPQRAVHDPVVADRPVAIEPDAVQAYDENVSGHRRLDVERPRLRIAAEHARDPLFIGAASVYRGRVNGVTGPDMEHRWIRGGELAMKGGRHKLVALR